MSCQPPEFIDIRHPEKGKQTTRRDQRPQSPSPQDAEPLAHNLPSVLTAATTLGGKFAVKQVRAPSAAAAATADPLKPRRRKCHNNHCIMAFHRSPYQANRPGREKIPAKHQPAPAQKTARGGTVAPKEQSKARKKHRDPEIQMTLKMEETVMERLDELFDLYPEKTVDELLAVGTVDDLLCVDPEFTVELFEMEKFEFSDDESEDDSEDEDDKEEGSKEEESEVEKVDIPPLATERE